jgi:Na+-transporting NADH:ubiquinone oxidoreductase subunit E
MLDFFISTILSNNIALTLILGMCPLIAISTNVKNARGMGIAVVIVVTLTAIINYPLYQLLIITNTTDLSLLVFIITIAAVVQVLEILLEKYIPSLYSAFGVYLPLITVNCVVLAVSQFFVTRGYNYAETAVFSFGSSIGWLLAIVIVSSVREKLAVYGDLPKGLRGRAIVFIILGILALAFSGFAGLSF